MTEQVFFRSNIRTLVQIFPCLCTPEFIIYPMPHCSVRDDFFCHLQLACLSGHLSRKSRLLLDWSEEFHTTDITELWGTLIISDLLFAPAQQRGVAFRLGLCHIHGVQGNHAHISAAVSSEEQLTAVISAVRGTWQVVD